ncbi:unnamed protein product [Owenia fusiformis]|uniref:Uncharacterized protein n=1 Tax=Owenia fusiformis TaxID=6347 RepID=A0A8S4Q0T0_OWEFU|nr:unnamed protein product [Owenia fusiformis]
MEFKDNSRKLYECSKNFGIFCTWAAPHKDISWDNCVTSGFDFLLKNYMTLVIGNCNFAPRGLLSDPGCRMRCSDSSTEVYVSSLILISTALMNTKMIVFENSFKILYAQLMLHH